MIINNEANPLELALLFTVMLTFANTYSYSKEELSMYFGEE